MWGQQSLPHFDGAAKCRRPHFIDDCQKFSIYQISRPKKITKPSRITLDWPVQTAGQKESAKKWSNDTEISTKLKVMTLGRMRIASCW